LRVLENWVLRIFDPGKKEGRIRKTGETCITNRSMTVVG
jgi:hypothetical protein